MSKHSLMVHRVLHTIVYRAMCIRVCTLTGGPNAHHSCKVTLQPQTLSRYFQHLCFSKNHQSSRSIPITNTVTVTDAGEEDRLLELGLNICGEV